MLFNKCRILNQLKQDSFQAKKIGSKLMTILETDLEDDVSNQESENDVSDEDLEDEDFQAETRARNEEEGWRQEPKAHPIVLYRDHKFDKLCKKIRFDKSYFSLNRRDFLISGLMLKRIQHFIKS